MTPNNIRALGGQVSARPSLSARNTSQQQWARDWRDNNARIEFDSAARRVGQGVDNITAYSDALRNIGAAGGGGFVGRGSNVGDEFELNARAMRRQKEAEDAEREMQQRQLQRQRDMDAEMRRMRNSML